MDQKKILSLVSKSIRTKVDLKSNMKNTAAWDSLGHLSILSALDKLTKGKSSKIDLTQADSITKLIKKLKNI